MFDTVGMDLDAILMAQLMYKFWRCPGFQIDHDTCQPFRFRTFQAAVDIMYALEDVIPVHVFSLEFSN